MNNIKTTGFSLLILTFSMALLNSCQNDVESEQKEEKTALKVPSFNRDSAYAFVAKQLEFGPRVPNSEGHKACRDWLISELERFGASVIAQDFKATAYTGEVLNATNIIGQYNPAAQKRIFLAAHWDTRPFADSDLSTERREEPILGADDGASGVGVLLEIARQLNDQPIGIGVDIVLFDAEDFGDSQDYDTPEEEAATQDTWALGAQHWAANPHVGSYRPKYGILLDMVGAKGAKFQKEGYSVQFAAPLVNKIWTLAGRMGYSDYFVNTNFRGGITDDHFFVNKIAGYPMVDIINLPDETEAHSFGVHWHTHNDNLEVINKRTLKAVGQVVLAVVYRESNGDF